MKLLLIIIFISAYSLIAKEKVEIVLTFDDFPMESSYLYGKKQRVEIFLQKLEAQKVKAVFFCIGEQAETKEGWECVQDVSKDHLIANHSYKHCTLSKISLNEFTSDLEKTEKLLQNQKNYRKWFRFPYLDFGDRENLGGSDKKRVSAFQYLKNKKYEHAYVTINTFDWHVNAKLNAALKEKKEVDFIKLKECYLSLLEEWMQSAHNSLTRSYKKKFTHVLLLHQNDLNALFLEEITDLIKSKNWEIVSADKAFDRPLSFLAKFANSKSRLFKRPSSLSLKYIDEALSKKSVFKDN